MSTRMRMTLTIDVECPEDDIDAAFPVVRERLLAIGLGPWKWSVDDYDATKSFKRQPKWSPRAAPPPSATAAPTLASIASSPMPAYDVQQSNTVLPAEECVPCANGIGTGVPHTCQGRAPAEEEKAGVCDLCHGSGEVMVCGAYYRCGHCGGRAPSRGEVG